MPPDVSTDRRSALLDAALHVAGKHGLRAVTHRAVEDAAGLPRGTTVYYFRTKALLVEAMVDRLLEVEHARSAELGHALARALATNEGDRRLDELVEEVTRWVDSDRTSALAHYELMLAGAREPDLRAKTSSVAQELGGMLEVVALAAGSTDAQRDARMLLAVLDGLLLDRVTNAKPDETLVADGLRRVLGTLRSSGTERGERRESSVAP